MLFFVLLATLLGAYTVIFIVVSLSPTSLVVVLIIILVVWSVFRSYRKWVDSRHDEESGSEGVPEQFVIFSVFGLKCFTETLFHKN
jgi:predicted neutral ceramidase superfamily lipid hydrolase